MKCRVICASNLNTLGQVGGALQAHSASRARAQAWARSVLADVVGSSGAKPGAVKMFIDGESRSSKAATL